MGSVHRCINVNVAPLGKSSLTVQFVEGHFVDSYYPTIENNFGKVIKYRGQDFATEIVDTAGQVSQASSVPTLFQLPIVTLQSSLFVSIPKAACCSADRPFSDLSRALVNRMSTVYLIRSISLVYMDICSSILWLRSSRF